MEHEYGLEHRILRYHPVYPVNSQIGQLKFWPCLQHDSSENKLLTAIRI